MPFITEKEIKQILKVRIYEPKKPPPPPPPPPPPGDELKKLCVKIFKLWENDKFNENRFSRKEIKNFPFVIYYSMNGKKIINQPKLLIEILKILYNQPKSYIVNRVILEYLKNFDLSNGNYIVRRFILSVLTNQNWKNKSIYKWQINKNLLFKENSINKIAESLLISNNPQEFLEDLNIKNDLFRSNFVKFIIIKFSEKLKLYKNKKQIEKFFELIHDENNKLIFNDDDFLCKTASNIIPIIPDDLKEKVYLFYLKKIGHPLLPGYKIKWKNVSKEAYEKFKSWLNLKNIKIFFELISKAPNCDPKWKYRKKFWESAIPYIYNTWIILPSSKIKELGNILNEKGLFFGKLKGSYHNQFVFLLEIKNYIFVEWSHGGALRIFKKENIPFELGRAYYTAHSLRDDNYEEKINHIFPEKYRWQYDLNAWLYKNLGIYLENFKLNGD